MNGVDKYVTESMLTKQEEDIASGKPKAKARPRQNPAVTLTTVSVPLLERKWIDIESQRSHDHKCYEVSKAVTRLLRNDQSVPRGSDGAIHYSDIIKNERKKKFDDASQWLLKRLDINSGKRRRSGEKISMLRESKLFQSIPVPSSIEEQSGESAIDPVLQYDILSPKGFAEHICYVGNASELIDFHNQELY